MKYIQASDFLKLLHLINSTKQCVFLDTSKPDKNNNQSFLFVDPVERLQCFRNEDHSHFLERMRMWLVQGYYLAGWIGYEFGYLLEESLQPLLNRPGDDELLMADLGVFRQPYFFNHITGEHNFPLPETEQQTDLDYLVDDLTPTQERLDYIRSINKIKEYIRAGDTYQVNYTIKLLFSHRGSTEGLYSALRRNQSVSYGALIKWENERVLSFSPELFFAKRNRTVTVKPMKGTLKRGRTVDEDRDNRHFLSHDPKNRSENVMIVDLLRNDLSHLMFDITGGKVWVESLFDVETYETLLQMTSTIRGEIGEGLFPTLSLSDLFKALFPCGPVTGAPKIRTMEIINELEKDRRGVYCGAIGYLAPNGDAAFNVPIRTIVLNGNQGEMGIGSGIVYDSDPENEWQECLLKGNFLTRKTEEFHLIESFLWEPETGYWLLNDHLERLGSSADYFLFQCDPGDVEAELKEAAEQFDNRPTRVRLLLSKDGKVDISHGPCTLPTFRQLPEKPHQPDGDLPLIGLSRERVDQQSPFLFHKTTRRQMFTREFKRAQQEGLFDICFLNKEGKLTEGCITNIFLYIDGQYITPPVTSGLLAGVMRKQLLEDKNVTVIERELTRDDLGRAEALFVSNSVRGVVRVGLATE